MKPSEQSVDPLRSEPCQQPDYRRIEGVAQSRGCTDPSHIGCIVIAGGVVAVTQGRVIKNGFRDENPAACRFRIKERLQCRARGTGCQRGIDLPSARIMKIQCADHDADFPRGVIDQNRRRIMNSLKGVPPPDQDIPNHSLQFGVERSMDHASSACFPQSLSAIMDVWSLRKLPERGRAGSPK